MVIGRFLGHGNVVWMTFAKSRLGHFHELRFRFHFLDITAAAVPHRSAQASHHLEYGVCERSFVRNPPFDPFRYELWKIILDVLEVAITAAPFHRFDRAHPPVHLVAPASRRIFSPGLSSA